MPATPTLVGELLLGGLGVDDGEGLAHDCSPATGFCFLLDTSVTTDVSSLVLTNIVANAMTQVECRPVAAKGVKEQKKAPRLGKGTYKSMLSNT